MNKVRENDRLFAGERVLVMVGLLGFVLAAMIAVYIGFKGAAVGPEGNLESAFSFNAAFGLFVLSIAAFVPLSGLSPRKRATIRWFFALGALYAYTVETVQHFRGINPRFTHAGTITDTILGALFGVDSLLLIVITVLLAIPFFLKSRMDVRPLLVLGIRYAFFSTMVAFAGGLWMIALQGRMMGEAGNILVLHGLGFHALQALPLLGWLLERAQADEKSALALVHAGGMTWILSLLFISVQTGLGRTVFEPTLLPILAAVLLIVWLLSAAAAVRLLLRSAAGESMFRLMKERKSARLGP